MKRMTLTALFPIALMVAVMTSDIARSDEPPSGTLTAMDVEAAKVFAVSVSKEEGTEAFTKAFKKALEILSENQKPKNARFAALSPESRGDINADPRYRHNLMTALNHPSARIWGGGRVPGGAYPDAVAILGGGSICTGTLIAPEVVVTAAHCHCGGVTDRVIFGDSTGVTQETIDVDRSVARIPCTTDLSEGDLALLFLERPAATTPRPLAPTAWIDAATDVTLVGFGRTEDPLNEPVGHKRVVDVQIASTGCNGRVETPFGPIDDETYYGCGQGREMVAGFPGLDRDSCNGDSGGPAYIRGPDGDLYVAGATSRAVVRLGNRNCGDGGIYARLDGDSLSWIQQQGVNVTIGTDVGGEIAE